MTHSNKGTLFNSHSSEEKLRGTLKAFLGIRDDKPLPREVKVTKTGNAFEIAGVDEMKFVEWAESRNYYGEATRNGHKLNFAITTKQNNTIETPIYVMFENVQYCLGELNENTTNRFLHDLSNHVLGKSDDRIFTNQHKTSKNKLECDVTNPKIWDFIFKLKDKDIITDRYEEGDWIVTDADKYSDVVVLELTKPYGRSKQKFTFILNKARVLNESHKDPRSIDFQSLHENWDPFEDRRGFMSVPSHLK